MTIEGERIPAGTLIEGRYEIREHLGEGGMGIVYRATDMKMGQQVALKMLLQGNKGGRSREERRRRFMTEIYAINEVAHRNVVQVIEFGFFKDTPFMVMELLAGKDLGRVIYDSSGPLPIDYCVDVMLVVCAAIQACHHKGIIHRDLKPGNIMVIETDSGHGWDVKVLDFSISSISRVAADLTRDGQILGTPRYLSPEQINGKILPASDQYAIGVLLYVCLTKQHPFGDLDGLPLIRAIERGQVAGPRSLRPEIPEALEQVILRAMSVDPAQRFDRIHDLGRALWPFGSPLGQGLWKKYYFETPPEIPKSNAAKRSTVGVPLLLQMAKGNVPSRNTATALAHYQSTTAVQVDPAGSGSSLAGVTRDDPEARSLKSDQPSAPDGWKWQSSTGGVSGDVVADPGSRKGRSKVLVAAMVIGLAVVVGVAVEAGRGMRSSPEVPPAPRSESQRLVPTQRAAPLPAPAAPMPAPAAPMPVAKPLPAVAPSIEAKARTPERAASAESGPAPGDSRSHRKHEKQPAKQKVQYTKDGVPILPAD